MSRRHYLEFNRHPRWGFNLLSLLSIVALDRDFINHDHDYHIHQERMYLIYCGVSVLKMHDATHQLFNGFYIDQLLFLENQYYIEFRQVIQNLNIRRGPTCAHLQNTEAIQIFLNELRDDRHFDGLFTFLRRAGHQVDGYIAQEIGSHCDEEEILLKALI